MKMTPLFFCFLIYSVRFMHCCVLIMPFNKDEFKSLSSISVLVFLLSIFVIVTC